ncbi:MULTISPECIES: hypothetical protein [Vibrio]|uniref:Uncharacterized protein n=1 Tax=Vibrio tasmaniensis TaxID=212663 RepID=A0A2N7NNB4_9VIBR|nr:hypothetical protein [Vibrio tasmaniensis]PMO80335.1 hypothetical protein BCT01_08570 [Vibrio tasmaniensis]PMP17797.1 hypothetical protein BCS92_05160 [Vibrio tasmaniensis]TKG29002.1 hypothetical protein FC057_20160 [Vibrio tasmaniensis]TKG41599.1 hypothetical protein FC063_06990 [Vibrio tasmaniensis]TKG46248.1 hypothetical protein FC070_22455 [Vibrio tasmaniensis]
MTAGTHNESHENINALSEMESISEDSSGMQDSNSATEDALLNEIYAQEQQEALNSLHESNSESQIGTNNEFDALSLAMSHSQSNSKMSDDTHNLMTEVKPEQTEVDSTFDISDTFHAESDQEKVNVDDAESAMAMFGQPSQESNHTQTENVELDKGFEAPEAFSSDQAMEMLQSQLTFETPSQDVEAESIEEVDSEQDNMVEEESYKAPIYLRKWFILIIMLSIISVMILGVIYSFMSASEGAIKSPQQANAQPFNQSLVREQPSLEGGTDLTKSGVDQLFNGLAVGETLEDRDYTDSDPITRKTILTLENENLQLKSDLSVTKESLQQSQKDYRQVLSDKELTISKLSKANDEIEKLKLDIKWLNKDITSKVTKISNLTSINTQLSIDVEAEKRISKREKEARLVAENRYVELVNSRSKELMDINQSLGQLQTEFKNVIDEKNSRDAHKKLRHLLFVNVSNGVGKFFKVKDGEPYGELLTLQTGENLIGRGEVLAVDPYGCIRFKDGKQYQPVNGFCP